MSKAVISDVSDTALWVAVYRANETERADALFCDPYAKILAGEKGKKIAASVGKAARYTSWSVIIRTYIIDNFIKELIGEGVDTVLNLGAGLDARPYRMELPSSLQWIEVDYPHMMQLKDEKLANETPKCHLERVKMDLANRNERQKLFERINAQSKRVAVLTEGVIPYLTEEQVGTLAEDLRSQNHFQYWILEYFSKEVYKYIKKRAQSQFMKNAPFQFLPDNWLEFFKSKDWNLGTIKYFPEETKRLGRKVPAPWWAAMMSLLLSAEQREKFEKMSGYLILQRK